MFSEFYSEIFMHALVVVPAQLQDAMRGIFPLLQEQRAVLQPSLHPQETMSLHDCGVGGSVSRFENNFLSTTFYPIVVGDGSTGFGLTDSLHTIA